MSDRVKVYEETKKKGLSIWAWLLPLLLLLAILIYFLTRHPAAQTAAAPATVAATAPDLGTVYFDTDQAALSQDDEATLTRTAATLKAHPNMKLRLEGYTDSTGAANANQTLSQRRASAVAGFLKGQGIDSSRFSSGGAGQANPAATNATDAGKADNRRVELYSQQ